MRKFASVLTWTVMAVIAVCTAWDLFAGHYLYALFDGACLALVVASPWLGEKLGNFLRAKFVK